MDGKIYDVSEDIVEGEVKRVTEEVSTAHLVLRNRYRKYIRDPQTKRQIFLPMDMITIWLQRISGKPIQVFTGYLDSVPYLQLYPGNCQITASCTLKKLAFTWFDPGLPFFMDWVRGQGSNWIYDPGTGDAVNATLLYGGANTGDPFLKPSTNDGSLGKLLYEFMTKIAGWPEEEVMISNLDPQLPHKVAEVFRQISLETQQDLDSLAEHLRQMMGVSVHTNADGTLTDGTIPSSAVQTMRQMSAHVGNRGITLKALTTAALALADGTLNQSYSVPISGGSQWGYGLYAFRPTRPTYTRSSDPLASNSIDGHPYSYDNSSIDGVPIRNLLEAGAATDLMVARMWNAAIHLSTNPFSTATSMPTGTAGPVLASTTEQASSRNASNYIAATATDNNKLRELVEMAIGRSISTARWQAATITADRYVKAYQGDSQGAAGAPSAIVRTRSLSTIPIYQFDDPDLLNLLDDGEKRTLKNQYQKASALKEILPFLYAAKKMSPKIKLYSQTNQGRATLYLQGPDSKLASFMRDTLKSAGTQTPLIAYLRNRENVLWELKQGSFTGLQNAIDATVPEGSMKIIVESGMNIPDSLQIPQQLTSTEYLQEVPGQSSDSTSGDLNFSLNNLAQFSADAAFAARFAFPSNILESQLLTGDKALMNDQSCLAGAQQFAKASLRTFMSLPDGRFLAFYPDYFGSKRGPYWMIQDIEIIDMGIQLNDESLATHVYTPGDTIDPSTTGSGSVDFMDAIASRGVVTVMQTGILDAFINDLNINVPEPLQQDNKITEGAAFLDHYGARPFREDQPIIRNGTMEFLYAFQTFMLKWAEQFATNVLFTFQPEVMPGGIIGFADHGIQMYVKDVTHRFSYESGFTTDATLMAPALMRGKDGRWKKYVNKYPGFALSGGVIAFGE